MIHEIMELRDDGLECLWSDLSNHPVCPHGPTLLFDKYRSGMVKTFYACSACRDRKLCPFYVEVQKNGKKFTEAQKKAWAADAKKATPVYNHRRLFLRLNQAMAEIPEKRAYCHNCNKLVMFSERPLHSEHEMLKGLTDEEMKNPSKILKPLSNAKKEAQYLFSDKTTTDLVKLLEKAGAKQVLCIGAPRIHEYITQNLEHKMSSLLLDFDARFHNFFGPLNYCWYNLFNHHFFTEEGSQTFRDFMTQNNGKDTFIVCDPPFGARVEPISVTLIKMADRHKYWNRIEGTKANLKIMFIFPYFMESIMHQKSNPPGIEGGLKNLKMSDYKVDYENHPLFTTGSKGRKHGSPVRIFTNINLKDLELPVEDGYKFCAKCQKWVSPENKHCKKCNSCTSKDGRRYKHCDICKRCVKPTWVHCNDCKRCIIEKHRCDEKPKITGRCFECGGLNHTSKDCDKLKEKSSTTETSETNQNEFDEGGQVTKIRKNETDEDGKAAKNQNDSSLDNGIVVKKRKSQFGESKIRKKVRKDVVTEDGELTKKRHNIASENGKMIKKRKIKPVDNGKVSKNQKTRSVKKGAKRRNIKFDETPKIGKTETKSAEKAVGMLEKQKELKKPELSKTKAAPSKVVKSEKKSNLKNEKKFPLKSMKGNISLEEVNKISEPKSSIIPKKTKEKKNLKKVTRKQTGNGT
ncbi:rRNA N6-adenosine-methyltransferase ZCCHC4 [Venturia canescens]|uniref:rRNA N6-adenosine-methyltransferase ZCCHC4 n=1 Tax=Venturia canescens TaxID=32260 RepID=UPI001C9CBD2D|nr:rRNA N6-adenosine-methyltransferase ZCCHC4 [Venturia canescens]